MAALAAGVGRTAAPVVVVLAGDLPWIGPAVPALTAALSGSAADVVELVDTGGRPNHLAAAWRRPALVAALAGLGDPSGASMRALVAGVRHAGLPDPAGWGRDCDTWDDVAPGRAPRATRRRRPVSEQNRVLDDWIADLAEALGLDPAAVDRDLLLDLARDAAHR